MTRSLTKTIHICFGGIITASFLHFMGYFNYINHVKPVDKGVIQYRALEINKNNTEDVKMEGFPIMNTSIYNWHPKDLIRMPIPNYLPGMKTPCFFVEDDGSSEHSKGYVTMYVYVCVYTSLSNALSPNQKHCTHYTTVRRQ